MAVRIANPAVNIREKLAELERPIGLNGSALMRTETPQEAFSLIGAGRRNLIINGNFSISQRGDYTSSTAIPAFGYFLDRWLTIRGTGATIQHKKNQVLPNGDITNSALATATSANGYTGFEQFIEFPEAYFGQTFTVSFWIKTNYHLSEINIYNGSSFVFESSTGGTLNESSGQWKFYSKTFTMPSFGNTMFRIEFWTGSATSPIGSYIELAQVQVERGKIATPFEQRSFGEELALCQRYYYRLPNGMAGHRAWYGFAYTATTSEGIIYFPVPMRTRPTSLETTGTATDYALINATGSGINCNAVPSFYTSSTSSATMFATIASGLVAGNATALYFPNTNGYLGWSAEL